MKQTSLFFIIVIALASTGRLHAEEPPRLSLNQSATGLSLTWPAIVQKADGSVTQPYFELQRTFDLQRWEPIGERQRAVTATLGQSLRATQPLDGSKAFYRLLSIEPTTVATLGFGGAEVF